MSSQKTRLSHRYLWTTTPLPLSYKCNIENDSSLYQCGSFICERFVILVLVWPFYSRVIGFYTHILKLNRLHYEYFLWYHPLFKQNENFFSLNLQYVEVHLEKKKLKRLVATLVDQKLGSKVVVFCSTKSRCETLSNQLTQEKPKFEAVAIHEGWIVCCLPLILNSVAGRLWGVVLFFNNLRWRVWSMRRSTDSIHWGQ